MREEKDDFWNIAALLPKKAKKEMPLPYGEITPYELSEPKENEKTEQRRESLYTFTQQDGDAAFVRNYTPKENPFITRVRVFERKSHMHLFHGFKSDGALWQSKRGTYAPYVPYFSFVPQYEQLNAAQLAYYLYFRDEANAGRYLDAGQSYVLLYLFEIINLPDLIPPKIGVLRIARIWAAYRKKMPMLDKNLVSWLADYGILHGVPCPRAVLMPFLDEILAKSNLKEYYLSVEDEKSGAVDAIILLSSAYKYENSRYAQGEHKEFFCTHIRQSAATVLRHVFLDGARPSYRTVTKRYDAFVGALWAGTVRYELEVTYHSLTGTDDLKILMTAAIKYAENKLRAYFSVKSRLSVTCLPDEIRALIDAYFARALPPKASKKEVMPMREEYETLYEPLTVGISEREAEEIERESWENTWRLIPEEEKAEIFAEKGVIENTSRESSIPAAPQASPLLSDAQMEFLRALLAEDQDEAKRIAKAHSLSYLTLGEEINEFFADTLGDVVLDLCDELYEIVSDYENEIRAILSPSV